MVETGEVSKDGKPEYFELVQNLHKFKILKNAHRSRRSVVAKFETTEE